jgi:hypothetical protein
MFYFLCQFCKKNLGVTLDSKFSLSLFFVYFLILLTIGPVYCIRHTHSFSFIDGLIVRYDSLIRSQLKCPSPIRNNTTAVQQKQRITFFFCKMFWCLEGTSCLVVGSTDNYCCSVVKNLMDHIKRNDRSLLDTGCFIMTMPYHILRTLSFSFREVKAFSVSPSPLSPDLGPSECWVFSTLKGSF